MPAIAEHFGDLLAPGFRKIFEDQFNVIPSMLPDLFNMQTSDKPEEKDSAVGGFSDFNEFDGTISYDEAYQQYDKTYTPVEFCKGFKVQRKLFDDDLYNIMNKKPMGLSISARRTREKRGAAIFNNAFTDASIGGDGIALCASGHTSNTPSIATQTNSGTSALSATSVEAARIAMADFRDFEGEKISIIPDLLLVPRALEQTAWEIISSRGKVETANNNANFHFGKYKLGVWDYLTDANNWFMIDSTMKDMYLLWFDRIPLEMGRDKDFDTYLAKFSAYMRFSVGYSDWRWIYGNLVS